MIVNIITGEEAEQILQKLDLIITRLEVQFKANNSLLYSNDELASKLKVSKKTLQNWRDQGVIEFSQIQRKIFYSEEQVTKFLKQNHHLAGSAG